MSLYEGTGFLSKPSTPSNRKRSPNPTEKEGRSRSREGTRDRSRGSRSPYSSERKRERAGERDRHKDSPYVPPKPKALDEDTEADIEEELRGVLHEKKVKEAMASSYRAQVQQGLQERADILRNSQAHVKGDMEKKKAASAFNASEVLGNDFTLQHDIPFKAGSNDYRMKQLKDEEAKKRDKKQASKPRRAAGTRSANAARPVNKDPSAMNFNCMLLPPLFVPAPDVEVVITEEQVAKPVYHGLNSVLATNPTKALPSSSKPRGNKDQMKGSQSMSGIGSLHYVSGNSASATLLVPMDSARSSGSAGTIDTLGSMRNMKQPREPSIVLRTTPRSTSSDTS